MTSILHLAGSALTNAKSVLKDLTAAVEDRAVLTESLGFSAPGDLGMLTTAECIELLGSRSMGRLAYLARAGTPDIVPVNYRLEGEDIIIRSGPGPKLLAAQRGERVAFEVDDLDESTHSGWSVVVAGVSSQLSAAQGAALQTPEPWASGPRRHVIRIRPQRITGRRLLS